MHSPSRRAFLARAARLGVATGLGWTLPLPAWAGAGTQTGLDSAPHNRWDLAIGRTAVTINGRNATALGINGSVPGPLLRLREGRRVQLNVANTLTEDSSIHWHGLILPPDMDGVPGISFAGIAPGATYHYEFDVRQNGTYWYHSHSGLQEQLGLYGPMIIEPEGPDSVTYDREFVVLLSDWTFEPPHHVMANLKKADDYYNLNRPLRQPLFGAWAEMRMSPTDIADITAATYTYLLNGVDAATNWTGLFEPGERIRLRIINGSAMSFFNVRIPGLPMTVVQSDGEDLAPVEVDELQVGTAETFDVVVTPGDRAYTLMAEAMDRSGFVRGTLAPRPGMVAEVPELREPPRLTLADMGMDHGNMGGHRGAHAAKHEHRMGPGVANVTETPASRLDHPGIGLENMSHRVLTYSDLRSLERNTDPRMPERQLEIHLTGNMHRYMWSFDGIKFSEVDAPIAFRNGERLRLVLVNDTMMAHPIHLHGMFMELVNGNGAYNPRKHTVVVKPAERLALDITADQPGRWAFHCHLLYHMKAGMMQSVRISDDKAPA